ncbi:hypothetical protein [Acinetobacter rathckeae]|uniref:hypothetical protein n=1 Tax=Acinetobacter rathckeae TaxID=2605272 RepID=UPI0018A31D1C|nr:hypothetical protein [Acinetobacter rathckeae]MBF7696712.1 hypothetical protein [Acinetobacter rathckeae]
MITESHHTMTNRVKYKEHADLEHEIEKFLAKGGQIKRVESVGAQGCFNPTAMKRPKKGKRND